MNAKNETFVIAGNHRGGINWPWLLFWSLAWSFWGGAGYLIFG